MANYRYKALNENGEVLSGSMEAESSNRVAQELEKMGLIPSSIKEKKGVSFDKINALFSGASTEDLIFFTRQLRTLVKSGTPLLAGLRAISEQTDNPKLKGAILNITSDLDRGSTLSDALSQHKNLFSRVYTSMVYTGEMSDNLPDVLERLIYIHEFNRKTSSNLKTAIRYPVMVICILLAAFAFLITFIIPAFAKIFLEASVKLPLPTMVMIKINDIRTNHGYLLLGGLVVLVIGFLIYINTASGRLQWDHSKLKIPILGPLFMKIYVSRFTYMLEALLNSGTTFVNALDTISSTIGNEFMAKKIIEMVEKVKAGNGVGDTFRDSAIFPPLVVRMIATGEEADSIEYMLKEITEYYEKELEYTIGRLSSYIEPILTITLGAIVLFFALAIFLPWWDMIKVFKGGM